MADVAKKRKPRVVSATKVARLVSIIRELVETLNGLTEAERARLNRRLDELADG